MGIGKRILNVLIGLLFIISVTVLGSSFLAKRYWWMQSVRQESILQFHTG